MLHKHVLKYEIATGDIDFHSIQVHENHVMIQVDYKDLVASDVTLELEQSTEEHGKFDLVNRSLITLNPSKLSHTWNIAGFAKHIFIRVVLKKGTATAGMINAISYL